MVGKMELKIVAKNREPLRSFWTKRDVRLPRLHSIYRTCFSQGDFKEQSLEGGRPHSRRNLPYLVQLQLEPLKDSLCTFFANHFWKLCMATLKRYTFKMTKLEHQGSTFHF